jgi:hypothetical protein
MGAGLCFVLEYILEAGVPRAQSVRLRKTLRT